MVGKTGSDFTQIDLLQFLGDSHDFSLALEYIEEQVTVYIS